MSLDQEPHLVHRSAAYQIFRLKDPVAGALIIKRCNASLSTNDSAWQALQNEHRILSRLQDVTGCSQVVRLDKASMELVLADFGGERLRQAVEACAIPHAKNSAGSVVTISVGVASMVPHSPLSDGESLLAVADTRLYKAKKSGRNRVVSE